MAVTKYNEKHQDTIPFPYRNEDGKSVEKNWLNKTLHYVTGSMSDWLNEIQIQRRARS